MSGVFDELIKSIFYSKKEIHEALSDAIKGKLNLSISDFSNRSGISLSTLYKILSGEREPNMRTFMRIAETIREIEGKREEEKRERFIAVIGSRHVLNSIEKKEIKVDGKTVKIKEFSVTNFEEALISAIRSEREGASAVVCAPILSHTIERILSIPVTTIKPRGSVIRAVELAAKKSL